MSSSAAAHLGNELGVIRRPWDDRVRWVICFPNTYYVGMSNLGVHALYRLINERPDAVCERAFLPDEAAGPAPPEDVWRTVSCESQRPLADFDVVGVSIPFEQDFVHVPRLLRTGGVPECWDDRSDADPLVIIGGPAATYNPAPLSPCADAFAIGEAECMMDPLMARLDALWRRTRDAGSTARRRETLAALADIPGMYVPSVHQGDFTVERLGVQDLDAEPAHTAVFTEHTEFGDMFLLEISRGCVRACRFCVVGRSFRPQREMTADRALELAVERVPRFASRVGLIGPSVGDVRAIEEICRRMVGAGLPVSLSSMRIERLTPELLDTIARGGGQRNITLAPEAGTDRLRRVVSKNVTDEQIVTAVSLAAAAGMKSVKLYFIIGLPTETDADIDALCELSRETKQRSGIPRLHLSISPFVPKPGTPFQWQPMDSLPNLKRKADEITRRLRGERGITVKVDSPRWAHIQGILSRGGAELWPALQVTERQGGRYVDWRAAMIAIGIDVTRQAAQPLPPDTPLPWDFIITGQRKDRFWRESQRVIARATQPAAVSGP